MLYIMFRDGRTKELPAVESAELEAGRLVCRDANGFLVEAFKSDEVTAYGKHEALAQWLHEQSPSPATK
jgi:hypothetical protein